MATEIERKWLVPAFPPELDGVTPEPIEQGYLVIGADGSEVRLRRKSGRPVLTVKSSGTLSRSETEIDVTEEQYTALWPATAGRRVLKRRYRLDGGLDVDVYDGDLSGLIVAELEFASEPEAAAFTPPVWIGEDVTENRAYKNQRLAVEGVPPHG